MLLLIPYALLSFHPTNPADAIRVTALIVAVFTCVTLHEMGHTAAARSFGIEVKSIVLWPLGGFASLKRRPEQTWQNLLIVAAGPAVNLILALILINLALGERYLLHYLVLPDLSLFLYRLNVYSFLLGLIIANLSLFVFNLVPIYPLDGGQMARDVLTMLFGERRADQAMVFISFPLALILLLAGFVTYDIFLILTGVVLLFTSLSLSMRMSNGMAQGALYLIDRGRYYLKNRDFTRAVQAYSTEISRHPDRPGFYVNRAIAYENLMDLVAARADLDQALALDQKNVMAWDVRGCLFELEGMFSLALSDFNKAIEVSPDFWVPYADRASLYLKMGNLPQALADLERALLLDPNSAVSFLLRSMVRYQMGDMTGARKDSEKAMIFAPTWMLSFSETFLDNFKGRLNWVLDYYNRAVELFPNAYQAYQGRADALRVNDQLDWAVEDYHRAVALAPREAELYLGRGQVFHCLGQPDRAAADFRQAGLLANNEFLRQQAQKRLSELNLMPSA